MAAWIIILDLHFSHVFSVMLRVINHVGYQSQLNGQILGDVGASSDNGMLVL